MKKYFLSLCLSVVVMLLAGPALAQSPTSTLEKIKQTKEVNIGYRVATIPLSFVGKDGQPHGYSLEISRQVVEYLKRSLNMPDLKVNYLPISAQNRIDLIRDRSIDFECSSTTITPERAKLVGFSRPFYVSALTYMFDEAEIPEFSSSADLRGLTVVLIKGTTGAAFLQKMNEEQGLGINVIIADDNREALRIMEEGQAVAMFHDDVQLAGLRANSPMASRFVIAGKAEHLEPYGCMYHLGDDQFGQVINTTLVNYARSDGLTENYKKWFVYPIESLDNINLKMPMSRGTREARDALANE